MSRRTTRRSGRRAETFMIETKENINKSQMCSCFSEIKNKLIPRVYVLFRKASGFRNKKQNNSKFQTIALISCAGLSVRRCRCFCGVTVVTAEPAASTICTKATVGSACSGSSASSSASSAGTAGTAGSASSASAEGAVHHNGGGRNASAQSGERGGVYRRRRLGGVSAATARFIDRVLANCLISRALDPKWLSAGKSVGAQTWSRTET